MILKTTVFNRASDDWGAEVAMALHFFANYAFLKLVKDFLNSL